jgi:hypothetical protein
VELERTQVTGDRERKMLHRAVERDSLSWQRCDRGGEVCGRGVLFGVVDDAVDDPHGGGFVSAEPSPGHHELVGTLETHLPNEVRICPRRSCRAEALLGKPESRVTGRDREVGDDDEVRADPRAYALRGHDEWLRTGEQVTHPVGLLGDRRDPRARRIPRSAFEGASIAYVEAATEVGAFATQHHALHLVGRT